MTAHEILTAPRVVLHLPRRCALARKVGVRSGWAHVPRKVRLKSPLWIPLQSKLESAPYDSTRLSQTASTKDIWHRLNSHT
jgi:hypothetical protein